MNTKKANELLANFATHGITKDSGSERFQHVLDFQDIIGHSNFNDMLDYYQDIEKPERRTFLWVAANTLDVETFLDIIKKVVCHAVIISEEQRLYELVQNKLDYLSTQEAEQDRMKTEHGKMVSAIAQLHKELALSETQRKQATIKANKWDSFKSLIR